MKEEEIRPDGLVQEVKKLYAEDIKRLLTRKKEFIEVPCPACESRNYQTAFDKFGFTFVICEDCETMFINPRPTFEILSDYYATAKSYKYWNDYIFPASEHSRRKNIFAPRAARVVEICKQHNLRTNILVDVGAGFGTFCEEIKKVGLFKRIIAVEPTPNLAETCRKRGLEVIQKPIEEVSFENETVNVITNFEVIEHLFSPKDFLLSCSSVLPKGGVLILTCPNVKGFDIVVLKESSNSVDPEHLNYFNLSSISQLLKNCGFEVIERLTPGQLDAELVRKKALNDEFNISNHPFLKQILLDEWDTVGCSFQQFLADNLLSSHMWVVAKKV